MVGLGQGRSGLTGEALTTGGSVLTRYRGRYVKPRWPQVQVDKMSQDGFEALSALFYRRHEMYLDLVNRPAFWERLTTLPRFKDEPKG